MGSATTPEDVINAFRIKGGLKGPVMYGTQQEELDNDSI
jgi:hypothetical protein